VIWGGAPFPIQPQERPKPGSSWSWNLVNTFTPNLAAETILSYNHQSQSLSVVEPNPIDRGKLGVTFPELYPQTNLTNSIPNVNAGPISWGLGNPGWHNDGKDYAFTENVTYVRSSHTMKFGFYYNRDDKKQTSTWPMNSTINFNPSASLPLDTNNGVANLMLGNFGSYSQSNAHVYPYFRFLAYEAYAQDSWKISRRLTMEFGVRYSHMVPTFTYTRDGHVGGEGTWTLYTVDLKKYDATKRPQIRLSDGKIAGNPMNALSALGLVCDPCSGTPRGFSETKNLFAPRLGLAYDLFGDGKTALRGGFGVFHERQRQNNFYFGAGGNWPNLTSASQVNGNVSAIDLSVTQGTPEITPPGLPIWPSDAVPPSVYSWYGGVQRELPQGFSLDLSYAGNRAVHLMHQRNVNTVAAGTFLAQPGLRASVNFKDDALRPYYGWGNLNAIESLGYSRYNAMMLRLSRRMTNNLAFNFNYTLSKAQNIADTDGDQLARPNDIASLWGNANYDQTHVTTFDFIYQLPKVSSDNPFTKAVLNGWEITGMIRSQSGQPIWPGSNGNLMGVNAGNVNPDLVGDVYAGKNKHRWLNPDALRRPQDGQYGSLKRNELRLPGVRNVDASVSKTFSITEAARVVLRGEAFNLLNNAQIWGLNTGFSADNAGGTISSTNKNFGTPNSWREARIMQLALRIAF
jgi:hypothetical protein